MENKPLSLSKKLDGGYLHVKKRGSNVKKRTGKGGGYSNYLKRVNGSSNKQIGGNNLITTNKPDNKQKVVAIKLGGSKKKSRSKSPKKKNTKNIKDISESNIIPIKPQQAKAKAKPQQAKAKPQQATAKPQQATAKPQHRKGVPIQLPKTKGSLKKRKIVRRNRSSSKRSLTRRRTHDIKKGKRISVTKIRKLTNKDVNSIQSKLKAIKNKSTEEIKKELNKDGIKVTGKSPEILKDIYMYSKLCGINIKRE